MPRTKQSIRKRSKRRQALGLSTRARINKRKALRKRHTNKARKKRGGKSKRKK